MLIQTPDGRPAKPGLGRQRAGRERSPFQGDPQ